MEFELLIQRVERVLECGEIEPQDDVAAALVGRVATDVGDERSTACVENNNL